LAGNFGGNSTGGLVFFGMVGGGGLALAGRPTLGFCTFGGNGGYNEKIKSKT
jgi:hypothetical protein